MKILHFGRYETEKISDPIKVQRFFLDDNDVVVVNVGLGALFCFSCVVLRVCGSLCGWFILVYLVT